MVAVSVAVPTDTDCAYILRTPPDVTDSTSSTAALSLRTVKLLFEASAGRTETIELKSNLSPRVNSVCDIVSPCETNAIPVTETSKSPHPDTNTNEHIIITDSKAAEIFLEKVFILLLYHNKIKSSMIACV